MLILIKMKQEDNVYVTFTYNNTSGGTENLVFDDVTKRVAILENPSEYEVGVTNAFMRISGTGGGPTSGQFSRIVVTSNSIGVAQEFSNNVENNLEPIVASIQYGPTGAGPTYPNGYVIFPGENNSQTHYRDINNSNPLYRLNLSLKAALRDGSYEYLEANTNSFASVTLHFRRKR